jgi:GT2 family glycosyltransferase
VKVAAVIPNWNGAARLPKLLRSLAGQSRPFDQVIVVDNGSSDGSADLAQVQLGENRGFAVAVNRGVAEARGADWIAVLNNDVVLDARWLELLLAAPPEFALRTGRTLQAANPALLDGAGDALSLGLGAVRLGYGKPDGPRYWQAREVLGVCFAAALVRADAFAACGGLEERFFAYLEDVEFCLRAQLHGYRAWYAPEALAWHEGSVSSGSAQVVEWITANQILLAARYARGAMWPRVWFLQAAWAARSLRRGHAASWWRGLRAAWPQRAAMRGDFGDPRPLLARSEAQISEECGGDWTWRIYFAVFRKS